MKKILFIGMILVIVLNSCNSIDRVVDNKEITVDSLTNTYLFKDNQKKVTGTVIEEVMVLEEPVTRKLKIKDGVVKQLLDYNKEDKLVGECTLEKGKIEGKYKAYYPTGKMKSTFNLKDGKVDGFLQLCDENGNVIAEMNFKNGILHGLAKFYKKGLQIQEILYNEGKEIKSYKFDNNGNKIIPVYECLELVEYKTGYYEYVDYNKGERLYQPIVILKLKNTSDNPLKDKIIITGVFTSNDEEWSNESFYFQQTWENPLQPGLARQISIKSDVGWTNPAGVGRANISCQLLINGNVYKTVKIANKFLYSNRI